MVNWEEVGSFERFPKLNDKLKDVGQKAGVVFLDDGKTIGADVLQTAFKQKGVKGIKAKDTNVFVVTHNGEKHELWISATSYTNMNELKGIRNENGNTLVNAKVVVKRVSKDDPNNPSFQFSKA